MKKAWELRENFTLTNYGCDISKADYEDLFFKTDERIEFTFQGWDGKSYDGETRIAKVIRTTVKGYEDVRFIKVGKGLHFIEEDTEVVEKATGISHKRASWLVNVAR